MGIRKCVGLNDDRRPRFAILARFRHDNDITSLIARWRSGASNSEIASIQFNASFSVRRFRRITWAASRRRIAGERKFGTTSRSSRKPRRRRRSRIAFIR
jgi:hypothetical protein